MSDSAAQSADWQPLQLLRAKLHANCQALAGRNPGLARKIRAYSPSQPYLLSIQANQIILGRQDGAILPCLLSPQATSQTVSKVFPTGDCSGPVLIAGLDQGWIWGSVYALPVKSNLPGHRPPLYFLVRDIEQLWLAMHIHDWQKLLADSRVYLFVGPDAAEQFRNRLLESSLLPIPRLSFGLDPGMWPEDSDFHRVTNELKAHREKLQADCLEQLNKLYAHADSPQALANRLRQHHPLRILGVTSLYTTFLQHSTRDWLSAFETLGHQTRLLLEQVDSEQLTPLGRALACLEFQPDLILIIDHYRDELGGMPSCIPCVMWVQDMLPNILRPEAGAAQKRLDYIIGYGRLDLTRRFGYPPGRFMPAMIPVNEQRFSPRTLTSDELNRYGCDVSFVSHCSRPAGDILQEEIDHCDSPGGKRLLRDIYDRLEAIYAEGKTLVSPMHLRGLIAKASEAQGIYCRDNLEQVVNFFHYRIVNPLFRHQSLNWLADLDINLHLYGNGWENHPRFKRYARGPADNTSQLALIYHASRINLQVTPYGSAHQRLFEGLAAGGFFLLRYCTGDTAYRLYKQIWEWCRQSGITDDKQLVARWTPEIQQSIAQTVELSGYDVLGNGWGLVETLKTMADDDFAQCSSTLWPEYDQVVFHSRQELHEKVTSFLADEPRRRQITAAMRQRVLECMTYSTLTRKMMDFIVGDLAGSEPAEQG